MNGPLRLAAPAALAALAAVATLAVVPGCASDAPYELDAGHGGEAVAVRVLGDGFVRTGERRIPLDAFVLELRQRVRPMPPAVRGKFTVRIDVDPAAGGDAAGAVDRLMGELQIMGVGHADLQATAGR